MATAHPKSKKFAELSASERARRIKKIKDPKKRAAAARFWDVQLRAPGGRPSPLDTPSASKYKPPKMEEGNFFERAMEDIPKMGRGIVDEAKKVGSAIKKDVEKGRGLPGAGRFWLQRGTPFAPLSLGLEELGVISKPKGPWDYKKLPKSEQRGALDKWGEETARAYPGQLKMLADPNAWLNDPLIQVANLGSVVLPGLRVASVARLSTKIAKANPGMTKLQANKAAIVESYKPGLLDANGIKGGIDRKTVKGKYGDAPGRMPSRGPVGRGGQAAWYAGLEAVDRANPNLPFSASRRNAAVNRKAADRAVRRQAALDKKAIDAVTKGVTGPSRREKAAQKLGLAGRGDTAVGAALIAMLEGPKGFTAEAAVKLRTAAKEDILEQDTELRGKQDLIDDLQRQRDELSDERARAAEEAEIEGEEFDGALYDEGLSKFDSDIKNRTDMLDFDLARKIPEVSGSKSRDSIYAAMKRTLGPEKARQTIMPYDAVARARNPENPGQWYDATFEGASVVKEAQFKPAGEVLYRRGDQNAPTAEFMSDRGFHFPLIQALGEVGDKPMQAGQMLGFLRKQGISTEELRNSGVGAFLEGDKSRRLTRAEVYEHLEEEGYAQAYNPIVIINRNSDQTYGNRELATNWGPEERPELNSREAMNGEYHELTVQFPGFRSGGGVPVHNRAHTHWQNVDVVYHIRYQIFEDEDGTRVMLVEEIQSDAATDFREAKKQGSAQVSPDELAAEKAAIEERLQAAYEEQAEAIQAHSELREEFNASEKGFDDEPLRHRVNAAGERVTDASDKVYLVGRDMQEFEYWAPRRVPPSPMGQDKYVKNAVRQVMREADDNDVDVIVIADGTTQAYRNGKVELGVDDDVYLEDAWEGEAFGEWTWRQDGKRPGEALTNDELRALAEQPSVDLGSFPRQYNVAIPKHFEDIYGLTSEHMDDAYTGRYSAQASQYEYGGYQGYINTNEGPMPGTVIRLTDEAKEKSRTSEPMYRRNREGVAQGATEFLEDGRARLTMFETANVSTWIHELGHVALKDLDAPDQKVLNDHFGDGKPMEEWTEAQNENFARTWETYFRTGKAHPALQEIFAKITAWMKKLWYEIGPEGDQVAPEVADTFDRMLGRRYQNTVLLDKKQRAQVEAEIKDLQKALEDPDSLEDAATALAHLADRAEEAGIQIMGRNWKSEAQRAAGLEGLARRKNAVVEDYRRRGLVGHGEEARGYFPNMSMWEALGQPQVGPTRVPAVGATIGAPRVPSKAVNKKRNRLIRYQTGEVIADPNAVVYILRARQRVLETIRAREELYSVGHSIEEAMASPGWDPDQYAFVRNPDVTPETMRKATEAMQSLSREDFNRLSKRRAVEDADAIDTSDVREEMIWEGDSKQKTPDWVYDEPNVRVVPLKVAKNRVGDVFASAPRSRIMAVFGMANALARAASIYLPLGGARYVARNWIQNAVLISVTQPSALLKVMDVNWQRKMKEEMPDVLNQIDEEIGTIQAQALPEFNTRPQGKAQRTERNMNRMSGQTGEYLGRLADVPLRRASWRRHASKYGFHSNADYKRLLNEPELETIRDTISQRVREDMIDFDALTPFEKEVLTRYLFIWPFIRGATKWPFMYAREYPGRLAAASMLGQAINQEPLEGSISEMLKGKIGDRTFDFAWMNPAGPALENAQRLDELIKRNARREYTLKPLITESLAPQYRFLLDALTGDLGNDPEAKLATTFMPFFSTGEAAKGGMDPFKEFVLKTFGNQTDSRSIKKETSEWTNEVDAIVKWVGEQDAELAPETLAELERMKGAYADWTSLSKRAEWAGAERAEDSLGKAKRASLILEVAVEHYPEVYAKYDEMAKAGGWDGIEEVLATTDDDEQLDKIYEAIRDDMFGLKEQLKRDATAAGWKA